MDGDLSCLQQVSAPSPQHLGSLSHLSLTSHSPRSPWRRHGARPCNLVSLGLLRAPGCCFLYIVRLPGACSRPRPWSSSSHDTPSCRALDVIDEIPQRAPTRSAQPLRDVTNSGETSLPLLLLSPLCLIKF
uniref:Uncharacterized protein n=1 Tax=Zea mays TaxID=4577 RepID=A0A804UJ74_MAIZE